MGSASRALYRKYRSKSLAEVVGQRHITDILERALETNRSAHAYLFTGPRGVGKTSVARILAHEINNLPYTDESTHLDIIEIDAASNNGVDDVRALREKAYIAPASAQKKVYIIDEVHMLSKQAFNALLKILEEPPAHVVFILATTDVQKLPATIISRAQRFHFRAISSPDAISHLKKIANAEKINISDDALQIIATRGDGSFRDSISLLDQLSSLATSNSEITAEMVENSLGIAPASAVQALLEETKAANIQNISQLLNETQQSGVDGQVFIDQFIHYIQQLVPTQPQLLGLLDKLIDNPKPAYPYSKLLVDCGLFEQPNKPKSTQSGSTTLTTAPLAVRTLEVHETVEKLKEATSAKLSSQNTKKASKKTGPKLSSEPLNWDKLLQQIHETSMAVYSVLAKCSHEITAEGDLRLYTVNAFYKKKIDDPKYLSHLYESLQLVEGFQRAVHTIPTRAPMKDSKVAAVADIMGGGIEVSAADVS